MKRPEGMPFAEYKEKLKETNKRVRAHLKGKPFKKVAFK